LACKWRQNEKDECAEGLCKAAGYDGGNFVISSKNICLGNHVVLGFHWSYYLRLSNRWQGEVRNYHQHHETQITADCYMGLPPQVNENRDTLNVCSSCNPGWSGSDCNTPTPCSCTNGIPANDCAEEGEYKCESCLPGWGGDDCDSQILCTCGNGTPADDCTFQGQIKCTSCLDFFTGEDCLTPPSACVCPNGVPAPAGSCPEEGALQCDVCNGGWSGVDCNTAIECDCPNGVPGTGCLFSGEILCAECYDGWQGEDCNTPLGCICPNGTPATDCTEVPQVKCSACDAPGWILGADVGLSTGEISIGIPPECEDIEDSDCDWDIGAVRCKDLDCCKYNYKFGDINLSQSCRARYSPADTSTITRIVSDGSETKPHCSWWAAKLACKWRQNEKDECAEGLCKAAGYDGGNFVISSKNICLGNHVVLGFHWSYYLRLSNRWQGEVRNYHQHHETQITADCYMGTRPQVNENLYECVQNELPCACPNGTPAAICTEEGEVRCVSCNIGFMGETCEDVCSDHGGAECLASRPLWTNENWHSCIFAAAYCDDPERGADARDCCPATCGTCESEPVTPCNDLGVTFDGLWEDWWADAERMTGVFTVNYFKYTDTCFCMFNDWLSGQTQICADNYNYFRFRLKGGRFWSRVFETWEVYVYGDGTIRVVVNDVERIARGETSGLFNGGTGFGPSPNNADPHTTYEICFQSDSDVEFKLNLRDPVSDSNVAECFLEVPGDDEEEPREISGGPGGVVTETCTHPTGTCTPSWPNACMTNADCEGVQTGGISEQCEGIADSDCGWDIARARCQRLDCCKYQYRFGDINLNQSCRRRYSENDTPTMLPFCATPVSGTAGVCKAGSCPSGYTYCENCCDVDATCECDDTCASFFTIPCNIPHDAVCSCPNGIPANDCSVDGEVKCASCNNWWQGSDCNTPGPGVISTGTCLNPVATQADCEAAAVNLGLSDITTGSLGGSSKPAGCYWNPSKGDGFLLQWNGLSSSTATCSPDFNCICALEGMDVPDEVVRVTSDGTESRPYCSWWAAKIACQWNQNTKQECADALCVAAGYDGGVYVGATKNICLGNHQIIGSHYSYYLRLSNRWQGQIKYFGPHHETAVHADCHSSAPPPTNQPEKCHTCASVGDPHVYKWNKNKDTYYRTGWETLLDGSISGRDNVRLEVHHGQSSRSFKNRAINRYLALYLGSTKVCEWEAGIPEPKWVVYRDDLITFIDAGNYQFRFKAGDTHAFNANDMKDGVALKVNAWPEIEFRFKKWNMPKRRLIRTTGGPPYIDILLYWCAPGGAGYSNAGEVVTLGGICGAAPEGGLLGSILGRRSLKVVDDKRDSLRAPVRAVPAHMRMRRNLQEGGEDDMSDVSFDVPSTCERCETCCAQYKNHPNNYADCMIDRTIHCCDTTSSMYISDDDGVDCCDISDTHDLCLGRSDDECPQLTPMRCGDDGQCYDIVEEGCIGEWTAFSECSTSCGIGYKTKTFSLTEFGFECDYEDGEEVVEECSRGPCGDVCEGVVCDPVEEFGEGTCYGDTLGVCEDRSADMNGMFHYSCDYTSSYLAVDTPCTDGPTCQDEDCVCTDYQSCVTVTFRDAEDTSEDIVYSSTEQPATTVSTTEASGDESEDSEEPTTTEDIVYSSTEQPATTVSTTEASGDESEDSEETTEEPTTEDIVYSSTEQPVTTVSTTEESGDESEDSEETTEEPTTSYMFGEANTECEGMMVVIEDIDECESAAIELGARYIRHGEYGSIPVGCVAEIGDEPRVWMNIAETGRAKSNRRPICIMLEDNATEPPVVYVYGDVGTLCEESFVIADADNCEAVANALEARYIKSSSWSSIPSGCVAEAEDGGVVKVWFNTHETGKTNSNRRPICLSP